MPKVSNLFEAATEMSIKKSIDYNGRPLDVNDPRSQYFRFGTKSYGHMIDMKNTRLTEEIIGNATGTTIKEHLIDLVNYCSYLYSYIEETEASRSD